jgi:hypothetical protein
VPYSRVTRMAIVAATTIVSTVAAGTPALAAGGDTTPPTAPYLIYAQGYSCGQLIVGMMRSTDNVTPQSQLRYEVLADGRPIGSATDTGQEGGVWAWLQNDVLTPGSHTITVKAEDAAGNWSAPSNADAVTGYAC